MPIYTYNNDRYDIKEEDVDDFLAQSPGAIEEPSLTLQDLMPTPGKTKPTTPDAVVEEEKASDTVSRSEDVSSVLPSTDVSSDEIRELSYKDRQKVARSNNRSREYIDSLPSSNANKKKKVKETSEIIIDKINNIPQEEIDQEFINLYFKLDERPFETSIVSNLPGQSNINQQPIPIEEYLSPEKFSQYESLLKGEDIIPKNDEEQGLILRTKRQAQKNLAEKAAEGYLNTLPQDLVNLYEKENINIFDFDAKAEVNKDLESNLFDMKLQNSKNIDIFNIERKKYDDQLNIIAEKIDVLKQNADFDNTGREIKDANPATIVEYNKLIGEANEIITQYKDSELDLFAKDIITQSELINSNIKKYQENNKELSDQQIIAKALGKDYTFGAAAAMAFEDFVAGSVSNIGFMAAELGLEGLKNLDKVVNIVAGPGPGRALNRMVNFDLNELNQNRVDEAISFVQKQAVDYNKELADKREKTIPRAFKLDDIGKNDVSFFDWFTRASADNLPSITVSLIPGVVGLKGASALSTGMTFAQRKAALMSQKAFAQGAMNFVKGAFFISETGGKYGELTLDAAKAKEQIPFLQEQLRNTENLEERSAIQADIDDLIRQRDYTLAQKAFTSLAFGTTAMYAEQFGQTQMMNQGRSFIRKIGTKEAKKQFYDSYAKYITNFAGKAVFQGTSTVGKAVGINIAEESLTLIGQNAFDIVTLGEDKSILDGLNKDFFAQNVVASFGLAGPQLAGGTMNLFKNEFRSYNEVKTNQNIVKQLISNQKSIDNFSGDKRTKSYIELKNTKNSLIQDLAINDATVLQKLNSLSIGQIEEAADIQRQLRLIKGEARSLGATGMTGQDVTSARNRLETQYKGLFKKLQSILDIKDKNIRGKVSEVSQELGNDFVNTNAEYHFGLLDFMTDAALVMQGENGNMIEVLDGTKNNDESLSKFTTDQRKKILSARQKGSNATFVGEDIIIFPDNIEYSIGQTVINSDGKYAAVAPIHELFHIKNIKKGLIDKNGDLSDQGKKAVDEAVESIKEKKALGRIKISDKDYTSLVNRIESYKESEGGSEEALIALSDATLLGILDMNDFTQNLPSLKGYIDELKDEFFGNNSYLMQLNSASDVFKFIKNYQQEVEVQQSIGSDPQNEDGEITPDKESKGIVDEFKQMKNEDLVETINMLDSDPTSRSNAIEALIDKNPIIYQALGYNPAKGDVLPEDMRTAIEDELLGTEKGKGRGILKTFNPENSKFSTYLQNVFSTRKEQVYKRAGLDDKKFQTSSLSDERVREAVSQETEEQPNTQQDISPKSITRNKIALAADKTGINEINTPGIIKEISNIVKPILDKLDPTSPTFRQNFDTEAGKALKPLVKKLIGRDYAGFIQRNMPGLLKNLDMKYLVDADAGRGVFARFNKRLTKQADIDKAVDKGLAYVDPTKKAQGVNLYDRTTLTPQQAKNYYITNNTPSTTSNKRGKLEEAIGNRLAKDISMEISKDKAPQDRKNISEKLQVPIDLKFSVGIKRAINSIPSSQKQEVIDKIDDFGRAIKKGYSVDTAINQVYGFLSPKSKELFAKLIKPELNKIIVNQKDLETGKPKEIDIVKFLTDAVNEITEKEVIKKILGLGSGSLNFKSKEQLYGYFNLIDQFIESKIKNMDNDFDKAFYIVNTFAPTLTAAAKVSDGSLTWKTINNLPTLINKKTSKDKDTLRYSLFANNGQMGDVLIKPFLKNPELLVFKDSQLRYNGKKLFNTRVSQTVSPALTSIKKNGKLSDDLLNKSKAYAEQNTNAVIELATFFKKLKDTDAGLSMNDFGMFLQSANGDMSAMIRASARLDSVAGLNDNLSLDPKKWRFEHNPPARTIQVHLANYIQGNITETQLRKEFDNYTVSIIPKLMDDVINERYKDTSPLNATSKWQRYYNEYSFGRFPYVTTVYKPTKDGKYTTEEVGKFAPDAYKSMQAAELKNKKELAPAFKFPKSESVDNQQVLDKMAEIDKENLTKELKQSKGIDLSKDMNDIIQNKTGIASEKTYSRVKAEVVGANKGRFDFFISPSAEDFVGLLYKTLGKGKLGDSQMAWYKAHLLNPFARAMDNISRDRVALMNDFKALKKELKVVPKTLKKKVPGAGFTQEQAVRTYIWDKQGMTIPGMAGTDIKTLVDFVNKNPDLVVFADQLIAMQKGDQYAAPSEGWLAGSITTDLIEGINTVKRSKYLEVWQTNADQIFSEANLNKLEAAYGKDYRVALENSLQRMKTGKNRSFGGDTLTGRVTDWLTNSIGAIMFFNTRSAVLQTISAINFINFSDNNIYKAGKAFANQKQYWKDFKTLFNSDFLVERRDGLRLNVNEADIADMAKKGGVRGAISELLRLGFLPTQIADSFAIASGGSTFYRNRIKALEKQGLSTKEAETKAFQDFRETAEESQQSSRPDRISQQQAGPLGRIILAFANTPAQYARIIKKAASDLKNRRGDDKTNISKIIYYGVAQNLIFNALQQALFGLAFGDDEEELTEKEKNKKEKRYVNVANGMADSLLRGMGLGGAVFSVLKNTALRLSQESEKKSPKYQDVLVKEITQLSPPIASKLGKLRQAGRSYSWNRKEMMEKGWSIDNPAYLAAAQAIAATTNIPLDRALKKIDNIRNASNSDLEAWQRIASAAGWSAWELGIDKNEGSNVKLTRSEELFKLNKKDQIDLLLKLGLTKDEIKKLRLEKNRVEAIINKEKNNK